VLDQVHIIILFYHCTSNTKGCPLPKINIYTWYIYIFFCLHLSSKDWYTPFSILVSQRTKCFDRQLLVCASIRTSQKTQSVPVITITRINIRRSTCIMCVFSLDFHEYLNIWTSFSECSKIGISGKFILW